MRVAMVSGMHNNFVFVMPSFKRAGGSEFQKMHVEFYVNILARACSAQELDKNEYFSTIFLHTYKINIFGAEGSALLGTLS
jgi:hypothetical protein